MNNNFVIIFVIFLGLFLFYNFFSVESMTNVSNNLSIESILMNRNKKYKNDNVRLSSITAVNSQKMNDLNNALTNQGLKLIRANTKIKDIKTIMYLKNMGNTMNNELNSLMKIGSLRKKLADIVNALYNQLNGKKVCNMKDFLNYCKNKKIVTKMETFTNIDKTVKDMYMETEFAKDGKLVDFSGNKKIVTDFRNVSLKNVLESFTETKNSILLDLINTFERENNKKYDKFSKDDLVKLVMIFIKDIKKVLNEIKVLMSNKSNNRRLKKLAKMFIPKRNLFYKLKHHYKILSIYLLFQKLIDSEEQKVLASQCCSHKSDDKNTCYNFASNLKKSNPLVYGYSKYGFVKDYNCVSSDHYNQQLDKIILEQFDKPINFDTNKLLQNVYQLLSYYNIIDDNKEKTLAAVNLIELINLKSLLEIDDEESVFFNLAVIIEKEAERIKERELYKKEKELREKKDQIYMEEELLADMKAEKIRRDKLKQQRLAREKESQRQLAYYAEEKEIKERARRAREARKDFLLEEEAKLDILRRKRERDSGLKKAAERMRFIEEEAIEKARREEARKKLERERGIKEQKERDRLAREAAAKRNAELNLQARKFETKVIKQEGPISDKRVLINKIKNLVLAMRQNPAKAAQYRAEIQKINQQIKNL